MSLFASQSHPCILAENLNVIYPNLIQKPLNYCTLLTENCLPFREEVKWCWKTKLWCVDASQWKSQMRRTRQTQTDKASPEIIYITHHATLCLKKTQSAFKKNDKINQCTCSLVWNKARKNRYIELILWPSPCIKSCLFFPANPAAIFDGVLLSAWCPCEV